MRTCFVCGNKYNDKNRVNAINIYSKRTGLPAEINSISKDNKILRLCPNCVKAMIIGLYFYDTNDGYNKLPWYIKDELKYEESYSHRIKNIDSNGEQS